jgi:hypothetical protein
MAEGTPVSADDSFDLRFEWEAAPTVRAAELQATWARLELWVGDECVTRVEDIESASARRSLYVSLYPLAEWLAYSWWFLKADHRPSSLPTRLWSFQRARSQSWLDQHNVRAAGDGYSWPDLTIVPEGNRTRLAWYRENSPSSNRLIRFLSQGEALVNAEALERRLADFVGTVLTRLIEQGVHNTRLAEEWTAIQGMDDEEAEFCLAAARLGVDPYVDDERLEQAILESAEELDGPVLADFLDAVDPARIGSGLAWVRAATERAEMDHSASESALGTLRDAARFEAHETRAWQIGWEQARRVRKSLGVPTADRVELDQVISTSVLRSQDHGLQGLGAVDGKASLVLGRAMVRESERFAQARALWHALFEHDTGRFLITSSHTDRQKVERAFAAELLAPAEGIEKQLTVSPVEVEAEDLDDAADRFAVSSLLIRHQVDNQLVP